MEHGISYSEKPTTIVSMLDVESPTVVVGTAPLHLAASPAQVNEPILCKSFAEYQAQFGYSGDFDNFTCDEAAYTHFALYGVKPLIVINVLDTSEHVKANQTKTVSGLSNAVKVKCKALLSTLTVKSGETTLTKKTDYTAEYDDGELVLTIKNKNKITGDTATLTYSEVNPSAVDEADIITGIGHLTEVFPKLGMVPGVLIAPKWSTDISVATVMQTAVKNINSIFNCVAVADIKTGTGGVQTYSDCYEYKNANALLDKDLIVCWPKVKLDGVQYFLSSHLAALMHSVDGDYEGVPVASPSNHGLQINELCLQSGKSVYLDLEQANVLNSYGVVTALNMVGYRAWGNRTSIYPSTTDAKDVFICIRRALQYLGNKIIQSFFSRVDAPLNRVFIESLESSLQQYLNGLTASGYILGGTITFSEELNPIVDLIDGKIKFDLKVGFLVPAESIEFSIEFDPTLYETLFS